MSTDRELLEMAAKAAGIELAEWDEESQQWYRVKDDAEKVRQTGNGYGSAVFDPLDDDGDALRLSVTLRLQVSHWPHNVPPNVMAGFLIGKIGDNLTESYGADHCAATRRAIVRAAAEIGKAMP